MARASSDAPTAAPGLPRQPVARIDRALDVLNAPGSTRQEFQAYFNPRNFGPGDLEELSPELWEELRLDGAVDEYDLHMQDMAEEEAQGTESDFDRPPGLSEAAIADIPRTTLAGLEEQNPALYRDIVIGIQAARDRDPRDPESPLISEPEADDQPGSQRPGWSSTWPACPIRSRPHGTCSKSGARTPTDLFQLSWDLLGIEARPAQSGHTWRPCSCVTGGRSNPVQGPLNPQPPM